MIPFGGTKSSEIGNQIEFSDFRVPESAEEFSAAVAARFPAEIADLRDLRSWGRRIMLL